MSPAINVLLIVMMPAQIGLFITVMKRKLGASLSKFASKPADSYRRILTRNSPPVWVNVGNQLGELTGWKAPDGRDYRAAFELLSSNTKCPMGFFGWIVRPR